jgi:hypothetical protein
LQIRSSTLCLIRQEILEICKDYIIAKHITNDMRKAECNTVTFYELKSSFKKQQEIRY